MPNIIPTIKVINGTGKPRLIKVYSGAAYTSVGTTTFTSTTFTEAEGSATTITAKSVANPTVVTANSHGLTEGMWCRIYGETGGTSINGTWQVMSATTNTFTINVNVSSSTTASGSVRQTPAFAQKGVVPNQRLSSFVTNGSLSDLVTSGKILSIAAIDTSANTQTITVDSWSNGTPTATKTVTVDRFICDLPRCEHLQESFEPDLIIHELYRGQKSVKQFGYKYKCTLDYSSYISGDNLQTLKDILQSTLQGDTSTLVLIPRIDKPGTNYNVYLDSAIDLSKSGSNMGHNDFKLSFSGKNNVANLPFISSGYGYGYGTNYGTNY